MVAKPVSLGELMAFGPGARVEHPAAVVYLHGRHAKVENGCPWIAYGLRYGR